MVNLEEMPEAQRRGEPISAPVREAAERLLAKIEKQRGQGVSKWIEQERELRRTMCVESMLDNLRRAGREHRERVASSNGQP